MAGEVLLSAFVLLSKFSSNFIICAFNSPTAGMLLRYSQREWIGGLLRQRVNSSSNSALISCRVFASPFSFLLKGLSVCENFWLLVQALPQTEHLPDLLPYNLTSSKMGIGLFFLC